MAGCLIFHSDLLFVFSRNNKMVPVSFQRRPCGILGFLLRFPFSPSVKEHFYGSWNTKQEQRGKSSNQDNTYYFIHRTHHTVPFFAMFFGR